VKPYWQSADGSITVFHARWEDVHAAGLVGEIDLTHADPPYGVNVKTRRLKSYPGSAKRGKWSNKDFPAVHGDDRPFDPAPILALDRPSVLWGANHYSDKVPGSPSWILWDKRDGIGANDMADGELAWTNLGGPLRIFRHAWSGVIRASENGAAVLAPTQKPKALSTYVFQRAKLRPGALVFVPYLGSGPDLPAAQAMGLRVVACDVEEWCCRTAVSRLGAITPQAASEPVGPLFSRPLAIGESDAR
jgi:site-specific DNA-methyltransferase (adenine-specific)/modification methylase